MVSVWDWSRSSILVSWWLISDVLDSSCIIDVSKCVITCISRVFLCTFYYCLHLFVILLKYSWYNNKKNSFRYTCIAILFIIYKTSWRKVNNSNHNHVSASSWIGGLCACSRGINFTINAVRFISGYTILLKLSKVTTDFVDEQYYPHDRRLCGMISEYTKLLLHERSKTDMATTTGNVVCQTHKRLENTSSTPPADYRHTRTPTMSLSTNQTIDVRVKERWKLIALTVTSQLRHGLVTMTSRL